MTRRVDVAIVGAGTAGLAALSVVRRRTENFVLINDGAYGTTCARAGCIPSKTLIDYTKTLYARRRFQELGVAGRRPVAVDVPGVLHHVRRVRDGFMRGVLKLTEQLGDRSVAGRAQFVAPDLLEVNGERIEAARTIVATGSRPIVPEAWRALGERVMTTDELFEQRLLPQRIAVVGLGMAGAEMAQALARLGIEVTGFDAFARVAGLSDPQVNEAARALLRGEIEVHLGAPAELGGTGNGNGVRVTAGPACADVDRVLVAIGRRPNLDGLGLDRLGVALEADGRPFCDPRTMQLGDLPVFIAGDAIPHRAIFHEAADEGWIAGHNATRSRAASFARRTRLDIVFTDPELAVVGQPFAEVDPDETVVGEAALAGQARMQLSGQDHGLIRVYANRDSGRVVGAELCAPGGEHLAHLLALAVQQRLTVTDLLRLPFYHPTIEEALHRALFDAAKRLPAVAEPDLAACERPRADALA